MLHIKTFQFPVSNWTGNRCYHCSDTNAMDKYPYYSEEEIDHCINSWIDSEHITVKTISAVPYTIDRHNNGRADTIVLVYTITYEV